MYPKEYTACFSADPVEWGEEDETMTKGIRVQVEP